MCWFHILFSNLNVVFNCCWQLPLSQQDKISPDYLETYLFKNSWFVCPYKNLSDSRISSQFINILQDTQTFKN